MEVDGEGPRLRQMFCSLGEISRGDGSVVWCQGETSVACSVYGPGEAKLRQTEQVVDKAAVEVVLRPRVGMGQLEDKARESRLVSTLSSTILTVLHPRTAISINLQLQQEDGCTESACINAACLALLDASVSLKFLIASVTVVIMADGDIVCDPSQKQVDRSVARAMFTFSSKPAANGSPIIVSTIVSGKVSPDQLQQCLTAAHTASSQVFKFFRETVARKFSKEISS